MKAQRSNLLQPPQTPLQHMTDKYHDCLSRLSDVVSQRRELTIALQNIDEIGDDLLSHLRIARIGSPVFIALFEKHLATVRAALK